MIQLKDHIPQVYLNMMLVIISASMLLVHIGSWVWQIETPAKVHHHPTHVEHVPLQFLHEGRPSLGLMTELPSFKKTFLQNEMALRSL